MGETPYTQMAPLLEELADAILEQQQERGDYAVYGHSLGALIGFELVREIRRREGTAPVHLIVSGCNAPDLLRDDDGQPPVWEMSDEEVVGLLRRLGGTPEQILADRSILRLILRPFRGDLTVRDTYDYQPQPPSSTCPSRRSPPPRTRGPASRRCAAGAGRPAAASGCTCCPAVTSPCWSRPRRRCG